MHEPIEIVSEFEGSDEQICAHYALDALLDRERGTPLGRFYDYWAALPCGIGGLPIQAVCRPLEVLPAGIHHCVSWIDVRAENPMEFTLHNHLAPTLKRDPADLPDGALISGTDPFYSIQLAMECLVCKRDRVAAYHEIHQMLSGSRFHYVRLLVPVDDADGEVSRVYHVARTVPAMKKLEAV